MGVKDVITATGTDTTVPATAIEQSLHRRW
ncbi:hypothetical protein SUDANB9_07827 [Streptomyces sp. enrichment culture]|jgi:hypothetical protein